MKAKVTLVLPMLILTILLMTIYCPAQTASEWRQNIDVLSSQIEQYHPLPWARISR